MNSRFQAIVLILGLVGIIAWAAAPPDVPALPDQMRQKASTLMNDGNWKEALDLFSALLLDPKTDDAVCAGQDLGSAIACLQRLNRISEIDELREKAIAAHSGNWRLLQAAARSCFDDNHYGTIVAGKFQRGPHRGGDGRYVNSFERDRIRALQLMTRAVEIAEKARPGQPSAVSGSELAGSYLVFADMLMGYRGYDEAWRLQYLSDLGELPDYEDGYRYGGGGGTRGAPVDAEGKPVFHFVPRSWSAAANDGERWRWLLDRAAQLDSARANEVRMKLADFFSRQFGVQTLAEYGGWFRGRDPDEPKAETGTYALHTLGEDETIARLATGIQRFKLPGEFNFIRLYRAAADDPKSGYGENAVNALADIFENRRQYDQAAELWKRSIKEHGAGSNDWKQKRLDQILDNWGQFEPVMTHPAGQEASVEFRYRNAEQVRFTAQEINVKELLADVKDYLKSNPKELQWERVAINNIGFMLVEKNQRKYVGREAARWDLDLQPREKHFDRIITIKTPLKKAGAYLLTATLLNGNTCKIIIWINDTVIVKKPLDRKAYFFVADAVSGQPLPGVNIEFFGYRQEYVDGRKMLGRHYNVLTTAFAENSDANGQAFPDSKDLKNDYQWLIAATTPDGRLAYLGFTGVWTGNYYDQEYNQRKVFGITDRPVYRPSQPVKFKFWIRQAQYDQEDTSPFANDEFAVIITDPKQEKVFEKTFKTDAYAGLNGEFVLPADAMLGQYYAYIWKDGNSWGGVNFRVEEYKKPEFEVTVEAPTEPVMLGEKISATIKAKYYFGAPVKKAKIKYKVLRSDYSANWYPVGIWDWFYGPGYWWYAYDYAWYPGWREWGCKAPRWWWWPESRTPPEIVAEAEAPIGADGTFKVDIDTRAAAEMHGDTDHRYELTAEVTDESRRTIVGQGTVLVARKPFKVYTWVDRGHYRAGDVIRAEFSAQTLDNKPVKGKGSLVLYRIRYQDAKPVEKAAQEWDLNTDDEGRAALQIKASEAGQYRLAYKVTDAKRHAIEGGYVFCVRGDTSDGKAFRFNEIELVPDKREYAPGDKVRLAINTDHAGGTVVLFVRPANGICLPPKILRLKGKSAIEEIEVAKRDMPNFFVEAFTVYDGKLHTQTREIIVPPEKRVLNVEVLPSAATYKPGEPAMVKLKLTDFSGKPFLGSTVISVYDKSVEYISGGSNVQEIKAFFWKWRRSHSPQTESNLDSRFFNLVLPKAIAMQAIGVFGETVADEMAAGAQGGGGRRPKKGMGGARSRSLRRGMAMGGDGMADATVMSLGSVEAMPMAAAALAPKEETAGERESDRSDPGGAGGEPEMAQPAIRRDFADTAYWNASLTTDAGGLAEVSFKMPENLTGWKIRTWAMGHGTKVGEASAEVVTAKNLLLRLQAPRFFVEKDEVVLSANIHNYLKAAKSVRAVLELDGKCLELTGPAAQTVKAGAGEEQRVDWRVKVVKEGEAIVRMKALTDEESDAMEMKFPVYVHGMLKTDSFSGVVRPEVERAKITINVPAERRIDETRLEVRYSPTLAGAMVDALPYLVEYPYGCTEQTLNRFLPTVMTQKILKDMGLDLKTIRDKRTNLNAQEIGDDPKRAAGWQRLTGDRRWDGEQWVERNPVFDEDVVNDMVKQGLKALTAMQISDGGWGWFSGWGEQSWPHTTAYVVHGLQMAQQNGVAIVPGVLERGVEWLARYQAQEVDRIRRWPKDDSKEHADNLDAFVYMALTDAAKPNAEMREFLYRDRTQLAVYGMSMFGMGLHREGEKQKEKLDRVLRNIEQFLIEDAENQTAYLKLGNEGCWWYWYGSEYEAQAYYLKLLAFVNPRSEKAAGLVKYLLNNRRHATYWNSTRDTALCVEALADYLRASGEDKPDMTVEIYIDGRKHKEARVTADNLFSFDNKLALIGDAMDSGRHTVEIVRKGKGPVYFNAYLTNFTLEDFITKAGLELKVNRKVYKLTEVDKKIKAAGARGQALDQKVEKYQRTVLANLASLKSGDLVEIELEIESKNDYEYIVFEDMKAAGFEPVDLRSGYNANDLGAYMELRDERVCFFARTLARGSHSVAYRMRAEIPGRFSALPARAHAMYAPELRANSDEIKLSIED